MSVNAKDVSMKIERDWLIFLGVFHFVPFRLLHRSNSGVSIQVGERLGARDLHVDSLLFEQQLTACMFERSQAVALRRIGVLVEEYEQGKDDNQRSNGGQKQHRAAVNEAAKRVASH